MSKYTEDLRIEVFSHYCGGHCQCDGCKVSSIGFLTLDHVNGDGAAHRNANGLGTGGATLWLYLKRNGDPEGYQVLCCNCNHSKFTGAACGLAGKSHCGERVRHVGECIV